VICIYLRINSDLCHLQHKLVGYYNRDEKCLLRGTDWVFKYSSLRIVFKYLILWCYWDPGVAVGHSFCVLSYSRRLRTLRSVGGGAESEESNV